MREIDMPDIEAALGHRTFLTNLARSLLGRDDRADDLVQEAYVAVLEGGPDDPQRVRGWMAGVVRRRAAGLWRRRGVEGRHAQHVARDASAPSVEQVAAREEIRRAVVEAMQAVAEPSRSALILRYYEGLPPRDVAARLGVPVETVRTRTKRGLAAMRARLDAGHDSRAAWSLPLASATGLGTATGAGAGLGLLAGSLVLALAGVGVGLWTWAPWESPADVKTLVAAGAEALAAEDDDAQGPVLLGRAEAAESAARRLAAGTARIVGRVLRDGASVACAVSLRRLADVGSRPWDVLDRDHEALRRRPARSTAATGAGGFGFDRLPAGSYLLTAALGESATFGRIVQIWQDGFAADGTLVLPRGTETLVVRAVYSDGRPYVGRVRLSQRDAEKGDVTRAHLYARTDSEGGVTFASLRAGWATLSVRTPQDNATDVSTKLPASAPLRLVVDRPGASRPGLVVDKATSAPLGGARISVSTHDKNEGSRSPWRSKRTWRADERGRFAASIPSVGETYVSATLAGYRPASARLGGTGPLRIELVREARITGRVVERGTTRGLAKMRVYGRRRSGGSLSNRVGPVVTDSEGRFALTGLEPGEAMIYAIGDGFCSEGLAKALHEGFNPCMHQVPAAGLAGLVLEVTPSATVRGLLTDKAGKPVSGVRVRNVVPDDWDFHPAREVRERVVQAGAYTVTAADGRFELQDILPGGLWSVQTTGHAILDAHSPPFTLEAGATKDVEIRAFRRLPDRRLRVTVLATQDGTPIEGAVVTLDQINPRGYGSLGPRGTTNAEGVAWLSPLTDAPMGVRILGPPARMAEERPIPVRLQRGPESRVTVRVQRMLMIRGRVTAPDGATLPFIDLDITPVQGPKDSGDVWTRVSDDGSFVLPVPHEGPWRLSATLTHGRRRWTAEATVKPGDRDVALALQAEAVAEGEAGDQDDQVKPWTFTVVGPDGSPVPHVQIARFSSTGSSRTGMKGGGAYSVRFTGHTPTFAMEAYGAENANGAALPYGAVVAGPFVGTRDGGTHVLRMGPAKSIAGIVRIDGKAAPRGFNVIARPVRAKAMAGWRKPGQHAEARTGNNGAFRLDGLGPYEYQIVVVAAEGLLQATPLPVAAGSGEVVVELRRAVSPVLTVESPAGEPVLQAHVRVWDPTNRNERGRQVYDHRGSYTDEAGRVTLANLDPRAVYVLEASGPRGSGLFKTKIERWTPADQTVRLTQSLAVGGTVMHLDGRPFAGANVYAHSLEEKGASHGGTTDAEGRFFVQGLTAGDVEVRVSYGRMRTAKQTVAAGARGLRFELKQGVHITARVEGWPDERPTSIAYKYFREMPAGAGPGDAGGGSSMDRDGVLKLKGLQPGAVYTFFVGPLPDGRVAYRAGVVLGEEDMEISIPLMPGGAIEGVITPMAHAAERLYISLSNGKGWRGFSRTAKLAEDGSFRIEGLPPVLFIVRAVLKGKGRERTRGEPVVGKAGDRITLKPPAP